MQPTLYIIRGLPGSGKSTLALRLVHYSRHREADQFFLDSKGDYAFDPEKQKQAHAWCQEQIESLMSDGGDCAVSNTFTRRWEYQHYIDLAEFHGYSVQVIDVHGPWRNTHGVPEELLKIMRDRWEPFNGVI